MTWKIIPQELQASDGGPTSLWRLVAIPDRPCYREVCRCRRWLCEHEHGSRAEAEGCEVARGEAERLLAGT